MEDFTLMVNNPTKIYLIKNLTPWMIDELIAFSRILKFYVVLLRKQDVFYNPGIKRLKENNINIYTDPFDNRISLKKIKVITLFIISNIKRFGLNYNGVIGIKSIFWFLRLDLSLFSKETNIHAQFATQASIISLLIVDYFDNQPVFSFTCHAYDIYFNNRWFNLLVNKCHKAFTISKFNIKYINENYLRSDKIILCRLGVFRNHQIKPKIRNSEYFRIGLMSWFVEKKGIKYLLEAFKKLKNQGFSHLKLLLAGDGPLKSEILKWIQQNNLMDNIEYLGKLNEYQKVDFFESIGAFILPSVKFKNDQDGIPVVLMEAITYGLPIISTNISGIPEICIDGYNGYIIRERNVEDIVGAIIHLSNSPEDVLKFGNNSIVLSDEFDIEVNSRIKLHQLGWI